MIPARRTARPGRWLFVAALVFAGCAGGTGEGPGKRAQSLGLTPEQEYELGRKAFAEILQKYPAVSGGPQVDRVRHVGTKIKDVTRIKPLMREIHLNLDKYRFEWEFQLLKSEQINAFCLPGGKVGVFTGLLPVAKNDDQLATVMAHEIAHALAHHGSERVARERMRQQALDMAGGVLGGDPKQRNKLLDVLTGVAGMSYDRQQESEADHIGVFLMTFAGYDPGQAVAFWENMEKATGGRGGTPEILSTHPSNSKRIAKIRMWAENARGAKKAYESGNILK